MTDSYSLRSHSCGLTTLGSSGLYSLRMAFPFSLQMGLFFPIYQKLRRDPGAWQCLPHCHMSRLA